MPKFENTGQLLLFLLALATLLANHFLSGFNLSTDLLELLAVIEAILGILFPTAPPTAAKIKALFD